MLNFSITTTSGCAPPRAAPVRTTRLLASRPKKSVLRAASTSGAVSPPPPITVTENALSHLKTLKASRNEENLLLRIGVRSGGCSGMSYKMDFENEDNISSDDMLIDYEGGFKMVCDPKSLLYLFGMQLDYSNELIGGGFQFHNPNAKDSCGCGKSFGV